MSAICLGTTANFFVHCSYFGSVFIITFCYLRNKLLSLFLWCHQGCRNLKSILTRKLNLFAVLVRIVVDIEKDVDALFYSAVIALHCIWCSTNCYMKDCRLFGVSQYWSCFHSKFFLQAKLSMASNDFIKLHDMMVRIL